MTIAIRPWSPEWIPAIREFNRRLDGGAEELRFPEGPAGDWLPGAEAYLAIEDHAVRGGYLLRRQCFRVGAEMRAVAHYRLPLSEGIVNKAYVALGVQMLRTALKAEPRLYALGMGGFDRPLPRMLQAMGWSLCAVPFWFRVARPFRFLRHIRRLRTTPWRRACLDAAAFTGAGWIAARLFGALRARRPLAAGESIPAFGPWADRVWEAAAPQCVLCAARDSATLNALYPPEGGRFLRVRTQQGWAVLLDTPMRADKYFGDMRVGAIVDCLAAPGGPAEVIGAAVRALEARGVDLIVTNQAHEAWCAALRNTGFLEGPSNFVFAASRGLSELAAPFEDNRPRFHINRGDGDGPVNL